MKIYYDFHIHTCLSPCGDDESTPNNVVNMAMLKGLDVIAITDHNSTKNVRACIEVGKKAGILVIAGMELTTSEDVHVVCLFETLECAEKFCEYVNEVGMKIKNRVDVFGHQYCMNEEDAIIGEEENLLIVSSNIGIYQVVNLVEKYGGVVYPAHINRPSNGVIAMLGGMDKDMGFKSIEVTGNVTDEYLKEIGVLGEYKIMRDSDAHTFCDILERGNDENDYLEVEKLDTHSILKCI